MGIIMPIMGMKALSPSSALFSATQQRVLALLFGQPGRSFFATELIALAASGSGAVQRELKRLTESDLVTVSRIGNRKHYQANPDSPIFSELCGIVEKAVAEVAWRETSKEKQDETGSDSESEEVDYDELFNVLEEISTRSAR